MIIAGIDYSMSAPAITIYNSNVGEFNFNNCKTYFLTKTKKYVKDNYELGIYSSLTPDDYVNNEDRWNQYSNWAMSLLNDCDKVLIEGFSFGSVSSMFAQICENAGVLKHKIFLANIPLVIAEPSKIKKFATNKGNADKSLMFEQFKKDTGIDLKIVYNMSDKQWEPIAGIIDSYYMCKYLYECC